MSDNINTMNFKQLRNEVQLLRDELAIMKRKYEDIIYNLDDDNFSSRFVKEKGDMRTAIEVNAEGIKTKVSNEKFESAMKQTAEKIETSVSAINEDLKNYSTIEQTAEKITATVTKDYVTTLIDGEYVTNANFETKFNVCAEGIYSTVENTYETKEDANSNYSSLRGSISSVSVEADNISTRVGCIENGEFSGHTLFKQTNDTFLFDGDYSVFTGCIWLTNNNEDKAFSIFLDENQAAGYEAFYLWGSGSYYTTPIIIGNSTASNVYIGNYTENNRVATRGWVLENGGSGGSGTVVAVFG